MSLANMKSRDAILKAVEEFDGIGRESFLEKYGFWKAKEFFLDYKGKQYDSKAIVGAAHGYEFPDEGPLTSRDFGGGTSVKLKLESLGFKVQSNGPESQPIEIDEAREASISLERDLEGFLAANLQKLEPGLRLYRANGSSGRQVDAEEAGRIDLLAVDTKNNLVVIEIKVVEADREVCGQIQAYMGWAKERLSGFLSIRGIIVASDFTDRLKLAVKVVPGLTLKKYRVDFEFSDS